MIFGILAQPRYRRPHRRQIHQQRHSGEVLQHNPRDHERNLLRPRRFRLPIRQRPHICFRHPFAVAIAQNRFQHQPNGHRQPRHRADTGLFELRQGIEAGGLSVARFK